MCHGDAHSAKRPADFIATQETTPAKRPSPRSGKSRSGPPSKKRRKGQAGKREKITKDDKDVDDDEKQATNLAIITKDFWKELNSTGFLDLALYCYNPKHPVPGIPKDRTKRRLYDTTNVLAGVCGRCPVACTAHTSGVSPHPPQACFCVSLPFAAFHILHNTMGQGRVRVRVMCCV